MRQQSVQRSQRLEDSQQQVNPVNSSQHSLESLPYDILLPISLYLDIAAFFSLTVACPALLKLGEPWLKVSCSTVDDQAQSTLTN